MDSDQPTSSGRKVKFAPKSQAARRKSKAPVQSNKKESIDAAETKKLLQHLSDQKSIRKPRTRAESKASVQPTFINIPKQSNALVIGETGSKHKGDDGELSEVPSSPTNGDSSSETEYIEPWDYAHSYTPITLPWRRPGSGDPRILDEAEFGEAARNKEYDERAINHASELGFLDLDVESEDKKLLFFQLPQSLPAIKRSATSKGKEKKGILDQRGSVMSATGGRGLPIRSGTSQTGCSLETLPAGKIGKLLVYKSGAVKLKLGDVLYDVSTGCGCTTPEDVIAINSREKQCCAIGKLHKHAVVTPNIDHLLNSEQP